MQVRNLPLGQATGTGGCPVSKALNSEGLHSNKLSKLRVRKAKILPLARAFGPNGVGTSIALYASQEEYESASSNNDHPGGAAAG